LTGMQQKVELQQLNDRLATYMDTVRSLRSENNRLTIAVQSVQETTAREVSSVKSLYAEEMTVIRQLLDETAKDKAKLQMDCGRAQAELAEMSPKYSKAKADLSQSQKNVHQLQTQNNVFGASLQRLEGELSRALNQLKESWTEKDQLLEEVGQLRQQIEAELLARTDLSNRNTTLKEELSFVQSTHEREVNQVRSRHQVEIHQMDGHWEQQYQEHLQSALQQLRDGYETQMQQNRDDIGNVYSRKVDDLEQDAVKQRSAVSATYEELLQTRSRLDGSNSRVSQLESALDQLKSRNCDLEKSMDAERSAHAGAVADCQAEVDRLRHQMTVQLKEYQDLMDTRTMLDMEIAAYRKLIEVEESRLNLTTASPPPSRSTPVRAAAAAVKRKRAVLEESPRLRTTSSAKSDLEIAQVASDGAFIRLENKGHGECPLAGWHISHKAGETEMIYKFHQSQKVAPGASVTVFSATSQVTPDPPSTLVMKEQSWCVADRMVTCLVNMDAEQMAVHHTFWEAVSPNRSRRKYHKLLAHQQNETQDNNRCVIM